MNAKHLVWAKFIVAAIMVILLLLPVILGKLCDTWQVS